MVAKSLKINSFNSTPGSGKVEEWNTRFGVSTRVVKRDSGGQFLNNVSAKQLSK